VRSSRWARAVFALIAIVALVWGAALAYSLVRSPVSGTSTYGASAGVACPAGLKPVVVGTVVVPAGPVAGFCQDRLINAAHIVNAAKSLNLGPHAQALGVMTAIGESNLRVLNYGDAAGADSRGLFQQRDNGAWGTLADRMNPFVSATHFYESLVNVDNWATLDPSLAAHRVQANSDPAYYDPFWPQAQEIVAALTPQ
jgi:hypothetical protein